MAILKDKDDKTIADGVAVLCALDRYGAIIASIALCSDSIVKIPCVQEAGVAADGSADAHYTTEVSTETVFVQKEPYQNTKVVSVLRTCYNKSGRPIPCPP